MIKEITLKKDDREVEDSRKNIEDMTDVEDIKELIKEQS